MAAAMTTGTIARNNRPGRSGMAHRGRTERGIGRAGMAGITLGAGWNMGRRLAKGGGTVVAGRTIPRRSW